MVKTCKQCTAALPNTDEYFRAYVSRGKGLRKTNVGRNTVCKKCERLNNMATKVWRKEEQTDKEREFLAAVETYYKALVGKGGTPIGGFGRHVTGNLLRTPLRPDGESVMDEILAEIAPVVLDSEDVLVEYDKLLKIELVDEPDVYQDMLDELREKSVGPDGRVAELYRDKFNQVAERFDDYEDNYEWQ